GRGACAADERAARRQRDLCRGRRPRRRDRARDAAHRARRSRSDAARLAAGLGTEPVVSEMRELADSRLKIEDYCREIETYLCQKNDGHLIRVVGPSFEIVSSWATRGVPIKIAFEGIDRYF